MHKHLKLFEHSSIESKFMFTFVDLEVEEGVIQPGGLVLSSKINFGTSETIESTDDYNNQVTPHNSFFNVVKQDRELMLETESSDPMLIGAGVSRFNSKNTFGTSGQSMEMFCHWAGDNRIDDGGSLGTTGSVSDSFQKYLQHYIY